MKHFFIILLSLILGSNFVLAQTKDGVYEINNQIYYGNMPLDANQFYPELVKTIVLEKLNEQRLKRKIEKYKKVELLDSIAQNQANYMSEFDVVSTIQKGKLKTTQKRSVFYGASRQVEEMVSRFSLSKRAGEVLNYENLSDDIVFKWYNSIKTQRLLDDPKYNFCGLGLSINTSSNKLYVSFILGNFKSLNLGAEKIDSLSVSIDGRKYGLKEYDSKVCRKSNSFKAIENLHKGVLVENGYIYFEYNDLRQIRRLIRHKKDALAIDIILKEQYSCNDVNIIDQNTFNKGILLKKVNAPAIYKNNYFPNRKDNKLKVELGKLPDHLPENYELNLVIIKNKHFCKNIAQNYMEFENANYSYPIKLVADTITLYSENVFKPEADTTILSFKIPFEKKKYNYKTADIEPFLKLLNEPEFIINELTIYAFTSIEGTEEENVFLQKQRAESIINALKMRQKDEIISQIITDYNWPEFKKDVVNTKHNILASMSLKEAQDYIRKYSLQDELETILKNHRYAQIDMKVTYDISDDLEEKFVLKKFNNAIMTNDLPLALSIQKFIFKKIMQNKYSEEAIYSQNIPYKTDFAGLLMNKLWLKKYNEKRPLIEYIDEINTIYKLDQENEYINFNKLFCDLKYGILKDERSINNMQSQIDRLYFSSFTKKTIDALNMEFQFKVIDSISKFENGEKIIEKRLNIIKQIYEINEQSERKALKIANLFILNHDYDYALKILEPFADNTLVSEELIFTFLALCSHSEYYTNTILFENALAIADYINHERFCKLFKGDKFSFQVFENPNVKNYVCETCN